MPAWSLVPCLLLTRCVALFLHRQTLFAAAVAPSCSLSRLPHALLWLWVHALQFGLANQTLPRSLAEDLLNHPDRPLPASRISLRTARTLRWMMIPICFVLSAAYGPRTVLASLCGSLYMLVYNDGGGARAHWLVRNALNAIGYGTAEAGTALVICTFPSLVGRDYLRT
jgi:4-hydroxybenzoate polyprenyltransferase